MSDTQREDAFIKRFLGKEPEEESNLVVGKSSVGKVNLELLRAFNAAYQSVKEELTDETNPYIDISADEIGASVNKEKGLELFRDMYLDYQEDRITKFSVDEQIEDMWYNYEN